MSMDSTGDLCDTLTMRFTWFAFAGLLLFGFQGVAQTTDDSAAPTSPDSTNRPSATALPDDADKAWKEVYKAFQPPMPPAQWQLQQPTPADFEAFRADRARLAGEALNKARE